MILHDERRNLDLPVDGPSARLGRDPALEITFDPDDDIVSAVHARVWREADGVWRLEDLGSTNGTWLGGRRIAKAEPLRTGDRFTLGQRGPALRVTIPGQVARTRPQPAMDESQPRLRLRRVRGGEDLVGAGREIVVGRDAGCTIPLRTVADTVVSKRHAVVTFDDQGAATIGDAGSTNGTFVNGRQLRGPAPLALGDRIMLGWHGPLFEVRALGAASLAEGQGAEYHPELQPPKTLAGMLQVARGEARRPGAAGGGVRAWMRAMARQMARESSALFRIAALAVIVVLAALLVLVYRASVRADAASRARLAAAERAFATQLRSSNEAQQRAAAEIARLRREIADARASSVPRAVVDSLEARLRAEEGRAAGPASEGTADFSRVAADNQAAVGLVVVRYQTDSVMGTGFVITPSGYLLTNGHVVVDPSRGRPRAIEVVMADTRAPLLADLVALSNVRDEDVAVLKIRNYHGAVVRSIDWQGAGVRQGAPAALIGFPRGTQLAFDPAGFVRTTMFAGIIAKATSEWIQFGGPTASGSSGSPVFNAAGQVIALHYGALADSAAEGGTPGLGFAIPIARARRWLPLTARNELGI
ncbi:MAG TPA: FHA domain-containing protein [Gemmatimonadales bacterium]|nr:FHA domain-containing protein [Gemmatimonadales bacterium]